MQKITPFLWFNDQAEEAINFYVSIFKNSKIVRVTRLEGTPGPKATVLTATFELEGQEFMALNGGPQFNFTPAYRFLSIAKPRKKSMNSGRNCQPAAKKKDAAGCATNTASPGRLSPPFWAG